MQVQDAFTEKIEEDGGLADEGGLVYDRDGDVWFPGERLRLGWCSLGMCRCGRGRSGKLLGEEDHHLHALLERRVAGLELLVGVPDGEQEQPRIEIMRGQ